MRMDARANSVLRLLLVVALCLAPSVVRAEEVPTDIPLDGKREQLPGPVASAPRSGVVAAPLQIPDVTSRANFGAAMQIIFLMTVLSLAPAILIMMTSFTRIIIVLSLLRQALGTQNLPPNQIIIGLSLFMTFLVMGPTWERVSAEAVTPYLDGVIDQRQALANAETPLRDFMIAQIKSAGNDEDVFLFYRMREGKNAKTEPNWGDVGTLTLVPGFVLSELKIAFFMGFKIYLPFLIIDMVISSVLISMGMMMLPPVLVSLPFKLLLFVLVDGWRLITAHLMGTFVIGGGG